MDNESLLLSSMRSLVSVSAISLPRAFSPVFFYLLRVLFLQLLQKCQMGIERLDAAEAREAEWVVERDELRASLAAKDAILAEEVGRNVGLVFDFEES